MKVTLRQRTKGDKVAFILITTTREKGSMNI
jgi:hypothetical protein